MKLNILAATFAAAALVSATPLRVVVVSKNIQEIPPNAPHNFRFGHPVAMINDGAMRQAGPGRKMRRPCAGRMGRFKAKALAISNAFRQALGLPLIESNLNFPNGGEVHGGMVKILPFVGTPPTFIEVKGPIGDGKWSGFTKGGERLIVKGPVPPPGPHRNHGPHHHVHHGKRPDFMERLHFSLLNLGPWESRAVAFVLGCGIGVLLRMFWVFGVIMMRTISGKREERHEYTPIAIIEAVPESLSSPPPTYVYPVDEKVILEETSKPAAPASDAN